MKKIRKFKVAIATFTICTLIKLNSISAAVSFNQGQATTDVKAILDPIANVMIGISVPLAICSAGYSYFTWNGKDEEEKEQMPFHKSIKKHVIAFVLFGLLSTILKWFTIS